ncbi:MAG: hypothetical protein JST67_03805 [Bacteroidetes bacterium]|nr:hypothetical protein [Bacteroidota bacterium]
MNKTILITSALLFCASLQAQNDTIKNYYEDHNQKKSDDEIKDFYPQQNAPQHYDQYQQNQQAQPFYPQQNQQQPYNNQGRSTVNKMPLKEESEFMKRLFFGSNLNLQLYGTSGYNVFSYDLSPFAGFKLNKYFAAGVQIIYNNTIYFARGQNISYSIVGGGLFVRAVVFNHLLLAVEYDILTEPPSSVFGNRTISGEKMAGAGYKATIATLHSKKTGAEKPLSYFVCLMYDFAPDRSSPYYYNQLVYRLGFAYNW